MDEEDSYGRCLLMWFASKRLADSGFEDHSLKILGQQGLPRHSTKTLKLFASIQNLSASHEDQLNKLCVELGANRKTCPYRFRQALSRVIFDGVSRGRVITIFNFTALLALYCAVNKMEETAVDVVLMGDLFLRENHVYKWVEENGGWDTLVGEPSSPILTQGLSFFSTLNYTIMGLSQGYHNSDGITT